VKQASFTSLAVTGLLLVSLASACDDEVVVEKATTSAAGASGSSAEKAAAPTASAAIPPRRDIPDTEFTETERSRDPFRSFLGRFAETPGRRLTPTDVILAEFAVDELKLVGIVTRIKPARAMLVDPTGKGHVVHRGDFIGRADVVQLAGQSSSSAYQLNWRLDRIRDTDVVLVREDPNNPDVPAATKVISLRPEDDKSNGT
jgi:type IV pilus assembly protein PilP